MRWMTAVVLVALLVAGPMGAMAERGRAAPNCLTGTASDLSSNQNIPAGTCMVVDLGVLTPGNVYDMSIVVVNDAIDLLFFDENGIQPYELGQSYRSSMAQPASTEFAEGAYEFHWKVPPSIAAKRWYMVLDNQAHDGDAGQGDQGGQTATVSASVERLNQAYWTPYHDLVAVPADDYGVLLSGDSLRLDAGTAVVVSAWNMGFPGDVYLQTRAMHDRYVSGGVGVQFIDGGGLQNIDASKSLTWLVPSSLEGEELLLVVDNTDTPLGGGNGSEALRMTVRLELAPPLNPLVVDDGDGVVSIGQTIRLDASSTPNRLGQRGTFTWDLDATVDSNLDGNDTNDADAEGLVVEPSWSTPGTKTVTVRMTAPSGEVAFLSYTVNVIDSQNPVPRVQATGGVAIAEGWRVNVEQTVTLNCASSTDDDTVTSCAWSVDGADAGTNTSVAFSWSDIGTYSVALTVTDASGNSAQTNVSLRVVDPSIPVIGPSGGLAFPETADEGDTLSLTVDVSDAYDDPANLRVHWDLQPTIDSDGNGAPRDDADFMGLNPKITLNTAGKQDIVVTVFDASNNSASYAFSVNVAAATEESTTLGAGLLAAVLLVVLVGVGAVGFRFWQRRLALDMLLNRGLSMDEARAHMALVAQQTALPMLARAVAYAGLDQGEVRPQAEREADAKQAEFDAIYGSAQEVDQTTAFAPPAYSAAPMSQGSSQAASEAAALLEDEGGLGMTSTVTPGMDALSALMDEEDVEEPSPAQPSNQATAEPSSVVGSVALPPSNEAARFEPGGGAFVDPMPSAGVALPPAQSASQATTTSPTVALPNAEPTTPVSLPSATPSVAPPSPPPPALVRHTCTSCAAVFEVDVPAGLSQALVGCPGCGVDQTVIVF
ncbi:MAG: PKD domain-containing protein [archaeon]|nr:PKD domain-containing protein [archaeon]